MVQMCKIHNGFSDNYNLPHGPPIGLLHIACLCWLSLTIGSRQLPLGGAMILGIAMALPM